ncbi:MAG TPA: peptidoglycan DD-metalloendopeptidase family protein [Xanthomonadales bacterium]|nr:peptidoglycan DD-metalloendopeptidase family protein [Xanthomonadales bacterium]
MTEEAHVTTKRSWPPSWPIPGIDRQKALLFAGSLVLVAAVWAVLAPAEPDTSPLSTEVIDLALPLREELAEQPAAAGAETAEAFTDDLWDSVTVKSGQNLDTIFRQQGFEVSLLHRILKLNDDCKGLTKIRPGDVFDFKRDDEGRLVEMRYPVGEDRYLLVRQVADELFADSVPRQMHTEVIEAEGVITSSLFMAGKDAGLTDAKTMDLANIFGWDIDFVQDLRAGDRFFLVYEKIYRDGEFLRDGQILGATFVNQGERFQAVWFDNGEVAEYYAPDGRNMKKAFLRAPLNFSYISSQFNPKRMHPVLKRIRPHNGIDYYAPTGTPVYAAGAGVVTRAGYSAANGNHVFIKHANGIETKYLHFSKKAVNQGQKVKQGQTIGYVGSTGLATGPHLHYEFVLNGVHRNPRTVPLPKVEALQGDMLVTFQHGAAPMLTQLSRLESASLYASRD